MALPGKKSMELEKKRALQPRSKAKKKKPADKGAARTEEAETPNGQEERGGGGRPSDNDEAECEAFKPALSGMEPSASSTALPLNSETFCKVKVYLAQMMVIIRVC